MPASLFIILVLLSVSLASLQNFTVDDTFGDPLTKRQIQYNPPSVWHDSRSCDDCSARPDRSQVFNGTWRDSTFFPDQATIPEATFQFTGSAIYVFCVLSSSLEHPTGNSDMTFIIDGEAVYQFIKEADGQEPEYEYNVLVYANQSLPAGEHTLTIQNGRGGTVKSLMLLDYIMYTREALPPPMMQPLDGSSGPSTPLITASVASQDSSKNTQKVKIIAAVCSTTGAITLLLAGLLLYCRFRRRQPRVLSIEQYKSEYNVNTRPRWLPTFNRPPSPVVSWHPSLFIRSSRPARPVPSQSRRASHLDESIVQGVRTDPATAPPPPSAVPDIDYASIRGQVQPERLMAVQEWRTRITTDQRTAPAVHPLDMSEVDLSSHYDESSDSYHPPPPMLTPIRGFTVMNA